VITSRSSSTQRDGILQIETSRGLVIFAGVSLVFWLGSTYFAVRAGQGGAAIVFLPMGALSALLLLLAGTAEMDEGGISYHSKLGRWRMAWDEIQRVESDGQTLLLCGVDKRLPFAPSLLAGPQKAAFMEYLVGQLERRGIRVIPSRSASYKLPRNTRV
jgi:hypothetical protein